MTRRHWDQHNHPCGYCGKACYPTRRAATRALRALHHQDVATMNAYRCQSGGSTFHIGHRPRTYQWPAWNDATTDQQCQRCPTLIRTGEPVATLGDTAMCFDCGDLAELAALSKAS